MLSLRSCFAVLAGAVLASLAFASSSGAVILQPIVPASVSNDDRPAQCPWESCQVTRLQLSDEGRVVFFKTDLSVLPEDAEADVDTYARDLRSRRTSILPRYVSRAPEWVRHMSADGRLIAVSSDLSDLVPGDTNGVADVFVHDRATGATERASLRPDGEQMAAASQPAAMSRSGRFLVITSQGAERVRDLQTGATHDVPVGSPDRISDDVRYRWTTEQYCRISCVDTAHVRYDRVTGQTTRFGSDSPPPSPSQGAVAVKGQDLIATFKPTGERRIVSRPVHFGGSPADITASAVSADGSTVAFTRAGRNLYYNANVGVVVRRISWDWPDQQLRSAGGLCVRSEKLEEYAPVEVGACDRASGDDLTRHADGTVRVNGKYCLSADGSGNGAPVRLDDCDLIGSSRRWWATPDGGLQNVQGGCLDVPRPESGTNLIVWDCHGGANQRWELPPVSGHLVAESGKCLQVSWEAWEDGAVTELYSCHTVKSQEWTVHSDGTIRALGRCLDAPGTANGTRIIIWGCHGGPNQQWRAQPDGSLRHPASGRCLDVQDFRTDDTAPIQLWDCAGSNNQRWTLPWLAW